MSLSMNDAALQRLRESRLLDDEQWRELMRDDRHPTVEDALAWLKEQNLLTDWQLAELLRCRRNFFLGKYRLLRLLGQGGMGEVYLAEHVTMHRRAAVKLISPRIRRNPQAVEQFLTEARSIAALDHPNIVHAYNVDTFGDQYYLVMEYVEGESLQELVDAHGPLPIPEAADVIRQCADGLSHVHDHGVLHCDIKPANLLINGQGVVKIMDLGMARLIQGERTAGSQPQDGLLGSVDFMAPETAMQSDSLDCRADIYSLGCTFFFALTGRAPFAEGTVAERILKHQMTPPPPLESLRPDVPEELARLCAWMLAKSPEDRPAHARLVVETIRQWEEGRSQHLVRARPLEEIGAGGEPAGEPKSPGVELSHQGSTEAAAPGPADIRPTPFATQPERKQAMSAKPLQPSVTSSGSKVVAEADAAAVRRPKRKPPAALIAGAVVVSVAAVVFLLLGTRRTGTVPADSPPAKSVAPPGSSPDSEQTDEFERGIEEFMRREKAKAAAEASPAEPGG